MTCYIVSFEIGDNTVLETLKKELLTFGNYCPINKNTWAVGSVKSATEIRDQLLPKISPQDRLFVIRSGTEAAWINSYGDSYDDWLKRNL